ncbi:MAG: DNA/RNA nuclease SfsA [Thermotogota bacterium]|nr:DNA/RNA nuclease SfsA [Thermotogota bacterium]
MKYKNSHKGKFIDRPNRFVANVEIDRQLQVCHVKNTGRCKELLLPGSTVYLEKSANPNRKTAYDLVAVEKGDLLINIDSQAPNKVVLEWLKAGGLFPENAFIQPEIKHENSRLDFYLEYQNRRAFILGKHFVKPPRKAYVFWHMIALLQLTRWHWMK